MKNIAQTTTSIAFAASLLLAGSSYAAGLSTAFQDAGIEKGTVAYHKVLSSLNMSNFNANADEPKQSSFKLCKSRWLNSPAGSFSGLTMEGEMHMKQSTGDKEKDPVETKGTFKETLKNVSPEGFDMHFAYDLGEDKKNEGVMKVTRAEYIVTCQELVESGREVDEELYVRYKHSDPRHMTVKTESGSYQAISSVQGVVGVFPNGSGFEMQTFSADAYFGVYRKALIRTDLLMMSGEEGKVESIMAMTSKVNKVSVQ